MTLLAGLPPEKLRWRCDPATIPFATTAEAEPVKELLGQERAFRALKMGVELNAPGFNIFVCGLAGTSRGGTITHVIDQIHPPAKASLDRCYVNNFKSPDRPRLLALPRGQANGFKKDMQSGIEFLRRRIPQVFEGEPFQRQKGRIVDRFTVREKELMDDFTRRIAREQFALGHMQVGAVALPEIFPVLEGQMVPIEDIPKMVHEGKLETIAAEDLERKYEQFRQEFTVVYRKTLTLSRELASELSYLEQEAASVLVDGFIEELKEKYSGNLVAEYLEEVRHNILDNLEPFKEREGEEEPGGAPPRRMAVRVPLRPSAIRFACTASTLFSRTMMKTARRSFLKRRRPTRIFSARSSAATIRAAAGIRISWICAPGRSLRADGGFLVMYAYDALTEAGVWRTLKRMLNHAKLEIQPLEMFFPFGTSALKPEPIDIDVKIILIGDRHMYEVLYEYEEDFRKIFKVRVEFDEEMVMSDAVVRHYGDRLRQLSEQEAYRPLRPHRRRQHAGVRRAPGRTAQQGDGAISGTGGSGARGGLHRAAGRRGAGECRRTFAARAKRASSGTTSPKPRSGK